VHDVDGHGVILTLSDEQQELAKSVRGLLDRWLPDSELRRLMGTDTGQDSRIWGGIADMGLLGLTVPESFGGLGAGWADVGVVLEEAGRALLCVPYFSTAVLATTALIAAEDEALQAKWLPLLASGECVATVALDADRHGRTTSHAHLVAVAATDGSWDIYGTANYVLDGLAADLLIVSAQTERGAELFALGGEAPGLTRTPLPTLDLTRKWARLDFQAVRASRLDGGIATDQVIGAVVDIGSTCLAAEALGGMAAVLEVAVGYAKTRYQFGRPIGSFQAIKHLCADMLVDFELSKSAVYHALWAADQAPADLGVAACLAKLTVCNAYFRLAAHNIQVHGGIGFTWEHSAHLHLKRAKSGQLMFGDDVVQRRLLADRVPIPAVATAHREARLETDQ
jgi:alkylation response protein AidB-like acyl-CoA dehydrogenase